MSFPPNTIIRLLFDRFLLPNLLRHEYKSFKDLLVSKLAKEAVLIIDIKIQTKRREP